MAVRAVRRKAVVRAVPDRDGNGSVTLRRSLRFATTLNGPREAGPPADSRKGYPFTEQRMSDATSKPKPMAKAGRALVPLATAPVAPRSRPVTMQSAAWAAALLAVFAVGAAGTHAAQIAWARYGHGHAVAQVDPTAQTLRRLEEEVSRLKSSVDTLRTAADASRQDETLRTLKHSVEALKSDLQQARTADTSSLQQITAKLDRPDRDPSPKLAEIAARLDKIEHEPKPADPVPATKVADLATRLDRIERQVAAPMPTGSIAQPTHPAPAAVTTVSRTIPPAPKPSEVAAAKPLPSQPPTVDAWVVRDVYDGMALVEARRGGLREIEPGEYLPGAGQVQSIERRGRAWVVLTSRGVIGNSTF